MPKRRRGIRLKPTELTMTERARGVKLDKIRPEDVARSGGASAEAE